ncbi:phage terminase small subunit P27 family [Sinisalibacter aestuarii]|uniref:Phage terminase small subunit P27 family n=1 Tax=Sinisalibacter aestuarii TaxID=2949426 RepID=A0ABQ5LY30_9RHOB|nr:phage terminase small subunit P27 family [Sinisalibacter aestuarii]GKY89888.1 hypothetical protein STA1M1_37570 [Sinisalibacter aestuarii]
MRRPKPRPKAGTLSGKAIGALPRCPSHLSDAARKEWRRLATPLHEAGLVTLADRAALAAYCQAWARWVEAEEHLRKTPSLLKTPSGSLRHIPRRYPTCIPHRLSQFQDRTLRSRAVAASQSRERTIRSPQRVIRPFQPASAEAYLRGVRPKCAPSNDAFTYATRLAKTGSN